MNKVKLRRVLRESIKKVLVESVEDAFAEVIEKVDYGEVSGPDSIYMACQDAADRYGVSVDEVAEKVFAYVQSQGF